MTATVDCGTLRNHENARKRRTMKTMTATGNILNSFVGGGVF